MSWQPWFYQIFYFVQYSIIGYVASINAIYFVLMCLGYFALRRYGSPLSRADQDALVRSPLAPGISIIAPAYNESATVIESVKAMLRLNYTDHEVIVVNDGSDDDTLPILIEGFRLFRSNRVTHDALQSQPIRGVYESRDPIRLVVVDKENGGKSDAINAGIKVARKPIVAVVDADSVIEPDALLYAARPFMEDERTLATGGIIRVANGCTVEHGHVVDVAAPSRLIPLFQSVEYLRAFLGGRVAFSFMNSLLLISGAFGLFRREAVIAAGGFSTSTVGEDMELVVRLHELQESRDDYRIVFVAEPVCWTEVPESMRILYRQRNRWQRGTVETLLGHKRLMLNPRYGSLGLFAVPYFAIFEMLGPSVELLGYVVTIGGWMLGLISDEVAILFFVVSILFSILLSMGSILIEDLTTRRYPAPMDVVKLFAAAVAENLGFRQLMTVWRTKALVDGLRGKTGWGKMERRGFETREAGEGASS